MHIMTPAIRQDGGGWLLMGEGNAFIVTAGLANGGSSSHVRSLH